jgi:hypothetical protein
LWLSADVPVQGELLPYQGGTNEMVVAYMYAHLTEAEKAHLNFYWYTGKDQITPLNARDKSRNCHVKLMSKLLRLTRLPDLH